MNNTIIQRFNLLMKGNITLHFDKNLITNEKGMNALAEIENAGYLFAGFSEYSIMANSRIVMKHGKRAKSCQLTNSWRGWLKRFIKGRWPF